MENKNHINRKYKDRLFIFLFGNEEHKDLTLSLYNAINGTHHDNPDDIHFNTIDDVIYMSMKNDVSFIIGESINIYEHQSTYNPNMPIRQLIYVSKIYEGILNERPRTIYLDSPMRIPRPYFIVFYNGEKKMGDETILKLSDLFLGEGEVNIELSVRMININSTNQDLMKACKPLEEYTWFIENIREKINSCYTLLEAVESAILEMPDDFIIKPIIMKNKAEVVGMILTEYDEVKEKKKMENSIRKHVKKEDKEKLIQNVMKRFHLTKEEAEEFAEETLKDN